MSATWKPSAEVVSIRPLVRYVDERQAVIDLQFSVHPEAASASGLPLEGPVTVTVQMRGPDAPEGDYVLERRARVQLTGGAGMVRFQLEDPQRWWPAGMGEQVLYELTVGLAVGELELESLTTTIGLTSVRPMEAGGEGQPQAFLVNGRKCAIETVVPVDPDDEGQVLPVAGGSLLVVRDHFGPLELYDAADRAGILLVQSVPTHRPRSLPAYVDRLVTHPSLAGWLVGRLGKMADNVSEALRVLDPTRRVFREWPGLGRS